MQRRKALTTLGGIAIGTAALNTLTDNSSAVEVGMGSLDVSDKTQQVATPVAGVSLNIDGSYNWRTSTTPTRAVLRLTVDAFNQASQLDAKSLNTLKPEADHDYQLQANLLSHPRITQATVTPVKHGETERVELTATVALEVYREGRLLGEGSVSDDAVLEVMKTTASIDLSLSGSGSLSVETSD